MLPNLEGKRDLLSNLEQKTCFVMSFSECTSFPKGNLIRPAWYGLTQNTDQHPPTPVRANSAIQGSTWFDDAGSNFGRSLYFCQKYPNKPDLTQIYNEVPPGRL